MDGVRKYSSSEYLILFPILALAFFLAFIPKHNYPYPVHVDEWSHWAYGQAVVETGGITFPDPLVGGETERLSTRLEIGFHVFWAEVREITGISWETIIRYGPALVFVFAVLAVYIFGRRQGFGWEAAFFSCLITTTVGILGPGFFVPVALALLFIPLVIFLLFNIRTWPGSLMVLLLLLFMMLMHPPSALVAIITIIPFFLVSLRYDWKRSLGLGGVLLVLAGMTAPWLLKSPVVVSQVKSLFTPQTAILYHDIPSLMADYGLLPAALGLVGIFVLVVPGGRKNYSLVLGLGAVAAMLSFFYTFHYGIGIVYLRGLLIAMLLMSLMAGAGLMELRKISLPTPLRSGLEGRWGRGACGIVISVAIVAVTLAFAIPARLHQPYYYMIDRREYNAFTWIGNNLGPDYEKAVLDPWKATAFSAITGRVVYARIETAPGSNEERATKFLDDGALDTKFLRQNGISIVYMQGDSGNPDLMKVSEGVYLLKPG
jgi:hypothetical protein